ncbi:MAG: PEP-CTERM sorting domain-containing protein [Gammaproteobacteria bacterium]|nr:PEP-CTERM sorting domain-containing protein [Gammaproteobacteria bacterium]MDH3887996.1 PEP-CTERM sorting domain-containing protein [Gammaproteobacteria bacterium]MDH3971948.1 PEP-CTERM sorting domain-containing protein [Gammaproteobacteria bacterium]MDH3985282.1 PEP-CTERM sorting domain-containing protein [Gammaproteobacteria bacterium]
MKHLILVLLLLASTASFAEKPAFLPGNNGNHYAYGKQHNNGNRFGASRKVVSVPEASTLALTGLGLAALVIPRRRKK